MQNLSADPILNFYVSSANPKGGKIEVRESGPKGRLLGRCKVPDTGSWTNYKTISCKLKGLKSPCNLYIVFKGEGGELLRFDWYKFETTP